MLRIPTAMAALLILGSLAGAVHAQDADACAELSVEADRLSCFDALFPSNEPPAAPSDGETSGVDPIPRRVDAATVETPAPTGPSADPAPAAADTTITNPAPAAANTTAANPAPAATDRRPGDPPSPATKRRLRLFGFGKSEKTGDIQSTVKAVRQQDKQKMVFLLENNQIWMQTSPRLMRIREGEAVTIKATLAGGHMLNTDAGVRTRVRRIR